MARHSSNYMNDRNLKGKNLEKRGKVDEAIECYEANVADRFEDSFPYDRLRRIYTDQKRYDEAIRVSKAFIDVANALLTAGTSRSDLIPKRTRFLNYIERLEQAKNRG
jgi:tetratricopeptide (TPR) repeat protein